MIDGLPLTIPQLGLSGVVVLFVVALMLGRLVPRSALTRAYAEGDRRVAEVRADHEQRVRELLEQWTQRLADRTDEAETWQLVAMTEREARQVADRQLSELLRQGEVTVHLLEAMREAYAAVHPLPQQLPPATGGAT